MHGCEIKGKEGASKIITEVAHADFVVVAAVSMRYWCGSSIAICL